MSNDLKLKFLLSCAGISTERKKEQHYWRGEITRTIHVLDKAKFAILEDWYVQVDATLTKGTIGKIVGVDFGERSSYNVRYGTDEVSPTDMTFIYQVEGRETTNRIVHYHATVLDGDYSGRTRWIRSKGKKTTDLPVLINKYKQALEIGTWVAGCGAGRILHFGQVTRYSKSSVWVNPTPSLPKSKENCINRPHETLVLPEGMDYEQTVTMMVLSGWRR